MVSARAARPGMAADATAPADQNVRADVNAKGGMKAGAMLAACVALLALPSAVVAFSASFVTARNRPGSIDSVESSSSLEALKRAVALRSLAKGAQFPFTPAGTPYRADRSVTVAVRVDPEAARTIIVRGRAGLAVAASNDGTPLRIAPAAFSLGLSRGYQTFAQDLVPPQPAIAARPAADLTDLHKFSLTPSPRDASAESRFSTHFSLDEKKVPGRSARNYTTDGGEADLSGAYRVTNNLDVTAGVRYSQDRDRLRPLTDGREDSQAVYVGTQFKF